MSINILLLSFVTFRIWILGAECDLVTYISSQLRYDGLDLIATSLAKCVDLEDLAIPPSSRLLEVMNFGLIEEKAGMKRFQHTFN